MKTLIVTEKPSVAMDFAKALSVNGRRDGYIEDNDYIITWAVGHLVELLEPQEYDSKWKKWSLDTLPVIPDSFQYKPIPKTKKQLSIIRKLLQDKSIEKVVIATDAGREGEVIARTILLVCGYNNRNRLYRFWSSLALTPSVIKEGMKAPKPAAEYDRLWSAGQSRQIADWLVGMNVTRAATVTLNDLYSVGRVQTAVLALLVDRRRARENFKPVPYWLLQVRFSNEKGEWLGTWFKERETHFDKKSEAEKILSKVSHQTGVVLSAAKEKKLLPPPLLYSLTDLQQDANRRFGFSAQQTLDLAQTLYEKKKCLSYPRTDSKVLGKKNADMVKKITETLAQEYPQLFTNIDERLLNASNQRVFNDAKLTDHHALIPLAPIPGNTGNDERKIYDLVLKRFAAAFHPDCEYEQTEIITEVEKETFRTRGKRILKPGWRVVYGEEAESINPYEVEAGQQDLPPLEKNDPAHVEEAKLEEKKTLPPPEYTEALLLKDMTNPGKYVSESDLKKIYRGDVGLGTQATRAQIIETLLKRKYISRKKKRLAALDKGCHLIDTLRRFTVAKQLASAEETARWEARLNRIAQGQDSSGEFQREIQEFVQSAIQEFKTTVPQVSLTGTIGVCPQCGGSIIEGKRGFGCSNWKKEDGGCSFVIWKTISGKTIALPAIKQLLTKKKIGPFHDFVSDAGELISAFLTLVQHEQDWQVELDRSGIPPNQKDHSKSLGVCPDCGGEIIEGKKGYGCSNWREKDGACRFVIWKTMAQKQIPKKAIDQLLESGVSEILHDFKSKKGKSFSARLKLSRDESGAAKIVFDFPDTDRM